MRKGRHLFWLLAVLAVAIIAYAYAGEVKLTTYYPAPYGEYKRIATKTLGVGDNDNSGTITSADAPDPDLKPGDVWIKGLVGIETTNPLAQLHISSPQGVGGHKNSIIIDKPRTVDMNMREGDIAAGAGWASEYRFTYTDNSGNVTPRIGFGARGEANNFWYGYIGTSYQDLWMVFNNGNVGIGTAGPVAKLEAKVANEGDLAFRLTSGTNSFLDIKPIFTGGRYRTVVDSGGNDRDIIFNSGNVGIGTTTPQATLDVTGTAILVPRGTSDPSPAINGMIYYNTSSNKFRGYEGGQWKDLK